MEKKPTEINAGSMADIAFLLLVFFLVTTSMNSDWGQQAQLPPMDDGQYKSEHLERDVLVVIINKENKVQVEGQDIENLAQLEAMATEFILNEKNDPELPRMPKLNKTELSLKLNEARSVDPPDNSKILSLERKLNLVNRFGEVKISKGLVSLQNDRGTSYERYIEVRDALNKAYATVRNQRAKKWFNKSLEDCNEKQLIRTAIPKVISEAEPVTS